MGNYKSQQQSEFEGSFVSQRGSSEINLYEEWDYLFDRPQDKFQMGKMIQKLQKQQFTPKCVLFKENPVIILSDNNTGIIYYRGKSLYYGKIQNKLYHGKGIIFYANASVYKGNFIEGKMNGEVKLYNNKKTVLKGQWREDRFESGNFEGLGIELISVDKQNNYKLKFRTGIVYEGKIEYKNNEIKFEGKGRMTYKNRQVYEGEWKQNKKHGEGIYTYTDGRQFVGKWSNGDLVEGKLLKNGNLIEQL